MTQPRALMTAQEMIELMEKVFPQALAFGFTIDEVEARRVVISLPTQQEHLRPGGTVSGPTMMTLADTAMWLAVLAAIGPIALAVTTNLNINFLRRPSPGPINAEARIFKLGTRLAVGDVSLRSEGQEDLIAHATLTYSIPPPEKRGLPVA